MRRWGALAVVAAVVLAVATPAAAQDDLSSAKQRAADAARRVADVQARVDQASRVLGTSEDQLGRLDDEVAGLQKQVDDAQATVARLRSQIQQLAVDQYTGAARSRLLLSASDINESVRAEALADIVANRKVDAIDQYRVANADLAARSAELAKQKATQQKVVDEQATAVKTIQNELKNLKDEKARLDALVAKLSEAERQRVLADLKRQQDEARRKAAEAAAAAAAAKNRPSGGGGGGGGGGNVYGGSGFVCPVAGAVSFVDSWMAPRSGGRGHQGVDMMAAFGTPVVAPVAGTVTHRSVSLGGRSYFLNGDDGNMYFGTHLSGYAGDGHVAAGTVIGYVGQDGDATTPHLHFEIHPGGGGAVNPYPTVAKYC